MTKYERGGAVSPTDLQRVEARLVVGRANLTRIGALLADLSFVLDSYPVEGYARTRARLGCQRANLMSEYAEARAQIAGCEIALSGSAQAEEAAEKKVSQ